MTPKRKEVPTCQFFCLNVLQNTVGHYIKNATEKYQNENFGGILEHKLEDSVKEIQQYLFSSLPLCLCSRLAETFLQALQNWLSLNISHDYTELTGNKTVI